MALVDKVEELGAAVEAGRIAHDEAVHQLQQYRLTRFGAADMLKNWRTVRATVEDVARNAEAGLAQCRRDLDQDGPE